MPVEVAVPQFGSSKLVRDVSDVISDLLIARPKSTTDELIFGRGAVAESIAAPTSDDVERFNRFFAQIRPAKPVVSQTDGDEGENDAEASPLTIPAFVPNVRRVSALLSESGVNLGAAEWRDVYRGAVHIAQTVAEVESIRVWGRVDCVGGVCAYYILETKRAAGAADGDALSGDEAFGLGVNEFEYFASTTPADTTSWRRLPNASASLIERSRLCRRLFRGRLDGAVGGFPRFNGDESALLRCIIARISHATILAPISAFTVDAEDGVVVQSAEYRGTHSRTLRGADAGKSWTHTRAHIRLDGRTTAPPPPEDEEEPAALKDAANPEAVVPPLRVVAADGADSWTFRSSSRSDISSADSAALALSADDESERPPSSVVGYVVSSAHSLHWPGAVSVSRGEVFESIYIGFGLKQSAQTNTRFHLFPFAREYDSALSESTEVVATTEDVAADVAVQQAAAEAKAAAYNSGEADNSDDEELNGLDENVALEDEVTEAVTEAE